MPDFLGGKAPVPERRPPTILSGAIPAALMALVARGIFELLGLMVSAVTLATSESWRQMAHWAFKV